MASKVALREFGQRLISRERLRRGCPFLEQCVGKLFTCSWATANNAVEFGTKKNVGKPNWIRYLNPRRAQQRLQSRAGEMFSTTQRFYKDLSRLLEDGRIEFKLAIVWTTLLIHACRRQLQQPTNVLRRDEVPRGPHNVRAEYLAFIKSLLDRGIGRLSHSERKRPLGRVEVLRLHRAKPAHHINGFRKPRGRQLLIMKSSKNLV